MGSSARYGIPQMIESQSQKHVTFNEMLRTIDMIVGAFALDKDLTAPPLAPADGDAYIIPSGATGLWAGKDGMFTMNEFNGWHFVSPPKGMVVYVNDERTDYMYNGSIWAIK